MGAATIDRLRDGAYLIELDGDTKRKPRPKPSIPDATAKASNPGSPQAAGRQR